MYGAEQKAWMSLNVLGRAVKHHLWKHSRKYLLNSCRLCHSSTGHGGKATNSSKAAEPSTVRVEKSMKKWNKYPLPKVLPARHHPIRPNANKRNVLVTSALPYVNNVPHLGNLVGSILSADVFSRYCRRRGYNVLYISGTDEFGTATERKAAQEGITPKELCDKYHKLHAEAYKWFGIEFDYFGRTTTKKQTEISQEIFNNLHSNGHIMTKEGEQLHCSSCQTFLADRLVEGTCPHCSAEGARGDQCDACGQLIIATELVDPRCKICASIPDVSESTHLYLDLEKLTPALKEFLNRTVSNTHWSKNAKNITRDWLTGGLKPRCITRDLSWGTPVPLEGFTEKVFYVWFDAPIGYISITANYMEEWKKWWMNPDMVELCQFMAKDNVVFHSIVFPATLLGAAQTDDEQTYTLVKNIFATGHLHYEGEKFSKSRSVGVFCDEAPMTGLPADVWRFYLCYARPESEDATFTWHDLIAKHNDELLGNLGNFINRSLKFLQSSFDGVVPSICLTSAEEELFCGINENLSLYVSAMEKAQLRDGLCKALAVSRAANQYFQAAAPWKLVKEAVGSEARERAATVLGVSTNICALLSLLIEPFIPFAAQEIKKQLNTTSLNVALPTEMTQLISEGHKIGMPGHLFKRIDTAMVETLKNRFNKKRSLEKEKD